MVGGVDSADAEVYPVTTVAEDASTAFSSICPTTAAAAYADDDPSYPAPVCNDKVTSSYVASITGAVVSIYVGDGPCVASACGVAVAPGRDSSALGATISTCGIMTMPGHAASPMESLCMPSFAYPSVDTAVTASETPQWMLWPS